MAFDDIYRPFLDSGRRLVRDSLSGARANPGAMVGVPNAQRDDPYPRFDPTAATRRDIGATAWGSVYGEEPRTPEELEVASGVDRRIPDAPRTWGEPTRIPSLGAYATTPDGGYAVAHGVPPPVRDIAPRTPFADAPGEDFEATRRRGEQVAQLMRETDGPFANPNDWNYIRSYGPRAAAQAVASGRANISGAPPELVAQERERFLRNRTTDLSISPQLRSAARDELAQIERDAAEERRREMWAAEQENRLKLAQSVPVSFGGGAGVVPDGNGGWTAIQPPAPEARPLPPPVPVSFGAGAGAMPDGQGGYTYQAPPQPAADPNAGPWVPGGGATSVNKVTGEVKTAPGAGTNERPQIGRFKFEENGITDTANGTRIELPPRDRKVVLQEMIDRATQQIIAKGDDVYGSGAKQIELLKAELKALSGEPEPTPAEKEEVKKKGWWARLFSGSDEPEASAEPAPVPAEPAAAAPAPAPTPAPAPAGRRRFEG